VHRELLKQAEAWRVGTVDPRQVVDERGCVVATAAKVEDAAAIVGMRAEIARLTKGLETIANMDVGEVPADTDEVGRMKWIAMRLMRVADLALVKATKGGG
jgi:hypothetical protein